MDLNLVRTFSRVVEAQSFTAAARSLGLPKSSVSRAISRLEEELGTRLFERTPRQIQLTLAGRAYYERTAQALAALSDAEQVIAEHQGEPRGLVRVTAPAAMDRGYLSDIVARFAKDYPAIQVNVSFSNRLVDLVREGFDLAIRGAQNGRLQGSSSIVRKVAKLSLWLMAAPSYLNRRSTPQTLADLNEHQFVAFAPRGETPKTHELKGPRGLEPLELSGALSSDDTLFIRELVLRGAGIGLMIPRMDDLRSGALVRVLPDYELPDLSIYLVMPSNRHLPRRVALFRDALIDAFKTLPESLGSSVAARVRPTGT